MTTKGLALLLSLLSFTAQASPTRVIQADVIQGLLSQPNYILNPSAETSVGGWSTYVGTASNRPVNGTGGSPHVTWAQTVASPLRGSASFLFTKSGGANRQGEGVSYAFTTGASHKSSALTVTFDYRVESGTFTAADGITAPLNDDTTSVNAGMSDLEVFVYDVTNSVLVPVSPQVLTSSSSTISGKFKGVFQTASNSTSYRLILHLAKTTTNNFTVSFDDFYVGPQVSALSTPVTDWIAYTPTLSTSTNVDVSTAQYRRVGDSLECRGNVHWTGTGGAGIWSISLPTGYTLDSTKTTGILGNGRHFIASGSTTSNSVAVSTGTTAARFIDPSILSGGGQMSGTDFVTNDQFTWGFSIPVTGLSSMVQMSNDTDTRVVAAIISGDPASASSGNPIIVPTVSYDSHGGYNATTGRYTVMVSGVYKMYGALASASSATTLTLYKNASSAALAGNLDSNGKATFGAAVNCVAGDMIDLRPGGTVDATSMTLNIERLSGPASIAATDLVYAKYYGSSTTVGTSPTLIVFDTKSKDTHGAYSAGTFTVPSSGLYQVCGSMLTPSVAQALNSAAAITLYKNGSIVSDMGRIYGTGSVTQRLAPSGCTSTSTVAGDLLTVKGFQNTSGALDQTSEQFNWVTFTRVGN